MLEDFGHGLAVQANQHLIVHGDQAMLLDPGGHKVYAKSRSEIASLLRGKAQLTDLFISHQDPDTCAALNGWLMTTDAKAYVPALWTRFITHFGVDSLVAERIDEIPDEGRWIELGGSPLCIIPAHYLHSCGNFHVRICGSEPSAANAEASLMSTHCITCDARTTTHRKRITIFSSCRSVRW